VWYNTEHMTRYSDPRKLELILLTLTLFTALCGLTLVFWGKQATTPLPAQIVNINTATAEDLAQALSVSQTTGRALVTVRQAQRGHQWSAVYDLKHSKVLRGLETSRIDTRFVARTAQEATHAYWSGVVVFVLAFLLVHVLMRRMAPKADPFLLPLTALLSGLGLILVYSVKDPYRDTFSFMGQVWAVAGYGLLALLLPLTRAFGRLPLRRYQYAFAALAVVLMVALASPLGHGPGHIHIQLLGVEPVEFIKLLLVFFAVSYLTERRGLHDPTRTLPPLRDFLPLALIYGFALSLFMIVKDLGPAVLLFGAFLTLLYLTTQSTLYPIIGSILLILAAVAADKLHFGFFVTRVTMWLAPWGNADKNGAQLADGLWGMATGGLGGSGLGLGQPQVMPRAGSDLIFASLGEQLGLVGTLAVLIVYTLILARGLRIALRAETEFDRLLAAGITVLLALQTMIIVGGVTGLVPLTGMTLPFVSFGGSSLAADFFSIGILLHLSNKTLPDAARDRPTPEWTRAARIVALGCAVYLLVGVGVFRLMDVQGVQADQLASRPLYSPDADRVIRPHINPRLLAYAAAIPRGEILDRNGVVLARDARPEDVTGTGLLTPDGRRRVYSGGIACAHLLMAAEGRSGLLGSNGTLRGFATYQDLLPFYRRYGIVGQNAPAPIDTQDQNVHLTIDLGLQEVAFAALRRYANSGRGAAVALNAGTGEVLAAVSLPSFDPMSLTSQEWAQMHTDSDTNHTLLFRATDGLYPPGSTFKIVTATAGLEHGLGAFTIDCHHTDVVHWRYGGHNYSRFVTDEAGFPPHDTTDMAKALRVSCNVYFANLGVAMGPVALDDTARQKFLFRHMPPLSVLGAGLPDCAFGQGAVLTSPLEMAQAAQAVANNGLLHPPTFLESSSSQSPGVQAMPFSDAQTLQTMLAGVVTNGTAQGVFDGLPVTVAGKTGSAQNNQGNKQTHSWFAGFAPAVNPTLAFACIVENGGAGRAAAAPVCREIIRKAL
jgi:cell division protein FtsI/penicillin-binding protein 2/cell division protein FtsW (lipid II flippase)